MNPSKLFSARRSYLGPIDDDDNDDDDNRSDTSAEIEIGMVKVPLEEKLLLKKGLFPPQSFLTRYKRFIYGSEAPVLLIFIFIPLEL